jgi:hypothetical protein
MGRAVGVGSDAGTGIEVGRAMTGPSTKIFLRHARLFCAALSLAMAIAACGDSNGHGDDVGVASAAITPRYGVDYSWARPSPSSLHAQGYTFVARYLSYDTTGKNLSHAEADALIQAGLDIVSDWEEGATDALSGYALGAQEAHSAEQQALADGAPADRPIFFSVDFDATPGDQTAIDSYFDGVASVLGVARTGAYGGYYVIKRLFDAGKIKWGWQTYAWSGGQWDSRAQLRQTQNGIAGGQFDLDEAVADDFGQWGTNKPPRGSLDVADCTSVSGWTQDPDTATAPIFTDVYYNGAAGSAGTTSFRLTANISRHDLCSAIGSCDHAFSMPTPRGVMDGKAHEVYTYGIDDKPGNPSTLLTHAPKSVTCALPSIPAGTVKRHVLSPTILTDWRFDTFLDMAHYTDAELAAVPDGVDFGSKPDIVKAANDPAVYAVDGMYKRHIVSPASLAAWRLTGADIKPITAAALAALTTGPDWPAVPLLADATGPAIYMLDVPFSTPPSGDGGADGGATEDGAAVGMPMPTDDGGSGAAPPADPGTGSSSSGCAVAHGTRTGDGAWLLLGPAAFVSAARRRRTVR